MYGAPPLCSVLRSKLAETRWNPLEAEEVNTREEPGRTVWTVLSKD